MSPTTNIINHKYLRYYKTRLCDLDVSLEQSRLLTRAIKQVLHELKDAGFRYFSPRFYIGDDWYSPEDSLLISIPFFLLKKNLRELEKWHRGYVEGETFDECVKLIRHETGHCFEHAYQLSTLPQWQKLFGNPKQAYDPDHYLFDPSSKDFVIHLDDHYAQAHPCEDFAETFAIWLDPESCWENEYKSWPRAYKKLCYIGKLVDQFGDQKPIIKTGAPLSSLKKLRRSLGRHYGLPRHIYQ